MLSIARVLQNRRNIRRTIEQHRTQISYSTFQYHEISSAPFCRSCVVLRSPHQAICNILLSTNVNNIKPTPLNFPKREGIEQIFPIRKNKNSRQKAAIFCCLTRIRTWTDRTKICSATVTPYLNSGCKDTIYFGFSKTEAIPCDFCRAHPFSAMA